MRIHNKHGAYEKLPLWVQHRWSDQQQCSARSVWHLPGGFLMEKALRRKVIILALEHSVIIFCEDKHIIKSRHKGRGMYSNYHPLEIYALQGWVLWVSKFDQPDEAEWVQPSDGTWCTGLHLHSRRSLQELMPSPFTVEVSITVMITPHQGHPPEGYRGDTDTADAHLQNVISSTSIIQGNPALNSEIHVSWFTNASLQSQNIQTFKTNQLKKKSFKNTACIETKIM